MKYIIGLLLRLMMSSCLLIVSILKRHGKSITICVCVCVCGGGGGGERCGEWDMVEWVSGMVGGWVGR